MRIAALMNFYICGDFESAGARFGMSRMSASRAVKSIEDCLLLMLKDVISLPQVSDL